MGYENLVPVSKNEYVTLVLDGGEIYKNPGTDIDFLAISKNEDVNPPSGFKKLWKLKDGFTRYIKPPNNGTRKIDLGVVPIAMVEEVIKRSSNASTQASNRFDSAFLISVDLWGWKPVYRLYKKSLGKKCAKKVLKRYIDEEGVTDIDTLLKYPNNYALNLLMIILYSLGTRWELDVWGLYQKVMEKQLQTKKYGRKLSYSELKELQPQVLEKLATGLKLDGFDYI